MIGHEQDNRVGGSGRIPEITAEEDKANRQQRRRERFGPFVFVVFVISLVWLAIVTVVDHPFLVFTMFASGVLTVALAGVK